MTLQYRQTTSKTNAKVKEQNNQNCYKIHTTVHVGSVTLQEFLKVSGFVEIGVYKRQSNSN